MYKTILAGLDGSWREIEVLRVATAMAERFGAQLHVCRAVTIPFGMPDSIWAIAPGDVDRALLEDATENLERRVSDSKLPIAGRHVAIAQPADFVIDTAEHIAADLIVIGAHGYGKLERLIGTTASKIVHRFPRSVLVVRETAYGD
jgi:nucleotide-binding universal stress UspA family protein